MLIVATDRKTSVLPFKEQISLIAEAGPDMIMLTERDLSPEEYKELAEFCFTECKKNGVEFCVDGFVDVARSLNVRSIHVDLDDLPLTEEGFDNILTTVRSEKEAIDAEAKGATMLIFREVFDLSCKSCRNAKGLATLRFLLGSVDIPVIGAGGILPDVFAEVLSSDAVGVCMKEGFMRSRDPTQVVKDYRKAEETVKKM